MIDNRTLKLFLALAETLHFGRASEISHVSPSTLSRTIKHLESRLGVTLFERDNRSVQLTAQGVALQIYARDALAQWEMLRNSLLADADELHGEISVYCSVTASYSFLYELLSELRTRHPQVVIKLHTGDPELSVSRVQSGSEEISIAARPESIPKGIAFKPMGITPLLFIAPSDKAVSPRFRIPRNISEWQQIPLIVQESGVARRRLNSWFNTQRITPHIYAQVSGNEAIVSMVSLGTGIGVVPKLVLDNSPLADKIQVLDIQPELEPYEVGLLALEKKLRSPLIDAFWSLL